MHEFVAAEAGADDEGVEVGEHGDDGGGDAGSGGRRGGFAHDGVYHEVRGVGFDHVGGGRGADDVGLSGCLLDVGKVGAEEEERDTRSAPGDC